MSELLNVLDRQTVALEGIAASLSRMTMFMHMLADSKALRKYSEGVVDATRPAAEASPLPPPVGNAPDATPESRIIAVAELALKGIEARAGWVIPRMTTILRSPAEQRVAMRTDMHPLRDLVARALRGDKALLAQAAANADIVKDRDPTVAQMRRFLIEAWNLIDRAESGAPAPQPVAPGVEPWKEL